MDDIAVEAEHCVNHPGVETRVRCSRCERPICPKCMIATPVGMRCRDCAQLRRAPVYELSGRYRWQALGAAVVLIGGGSFVFNLLISVTGRSIFVLGALFLLSGLGIAEALSRAANRKRGPTLQAMAIVTTALVTQSSVLAALVLVHRLILNPFTLFLTAAACVLAWQRLR